VEDRATLIIHKEIETVETVENLIRALNLLEQDGRIGGGKADINDLVEICLIEKEDWIMWRSGSEEKWRWDNVDEMGENWRIVAGKIAQSSNARPKSRKERSSSRAAATFSPSYQADRPLLSGTAGPVIEICIIRTTERYTAPNVNPAIKHLIRNYIVQMSPIIFAQ
jgi:hypothetical protein